MVRFQMELDSQKPPSVTDEWIYQLFEEFDQNKSGTIDDAEWYSLVAALRSRVASVS
jgi:Ca2+-binding EF-hand superfamily protein